MRSWIHAALLACGLVCGWVVPASTRPGENAFDTAAAEMERLAGEVSRHLVRVIRVNEVPASGGEASVAPRFIGTGISIGAGRILTCAGIVGAAAEVLVCPAPGDTIIAAVVGVDRRTNVALLRAPGLGLGALPVSRGSLLLPGEMVVAVGFGAPGGPAASFGTLVHGQGPSLGYSEVDLVQVTAPVFPGYTGGALVNRRGELVGVLSGRLEVDATRGTAGQHAARVAGYLQDGRVATMTPFAATVALPASSALEIAEELGRLGYVRRGYLGLQVELARVARERGPGVPGVMVQRVVDAGPAASAGLLPGDVILEYAGARVLSPEDLSFLVAATVPGSNVPVRFLRRGVRQVTMAEISQAPDSGWTREMDRSLAARPVDAGLAPAAR